MTLHDQNLAVHSGSTASGEVPFDPADLFYSRTDERGIIIEGNGIFRRISGYSWDELKGAPHKVIRHPDTPKGLFYLYWQRLKEGKAVVAYVKNKAKDGRLYWVMALAWNIEGGYIAIRAKPHSELFHKVRDIYRMLREEEEQGLSPERSASRLQEEIAKLGFQSYDSFMAAAIAAELKSRADLIGVPVTQLQSRFLEMHETILRIRKETDEMTEIFKAIRTVPMNMRIIASRLENAGGPISAISVNYGQMLDEMAMWVREFVDGDKSTFSRIYHSIEHGQLLVNAAALQEEMSKLFEDDLKGAADTEHLEHDRKLLVDEAANFKKSAAQSLKVVEAEAARLSRSVLDMKRYVTGLSSTRMMCKIESATLSGSGNALVGIVDQLDNCQDEIEARLARIVEHNTIIQNNTAMLRASD